MWLCHMASLVVYLVWRNKNKAFVGYCDEHMVNHQTSQNTRTEPRQQQQSVPNIAKCCNHACLHINELNGCKETSKYMHSVSVYANYLMK